MKKWLAALLAAILALGGLTACKKDDTDTVETYTPETVAPFDDALQKDYTDDADKSAYLNALGATFSEMSETDGALFTVTEGQNGVTVTGYTGTATEVRIPASIGDRAVVAVANGAFADNGLITKLYLPDSIAKIGEDAFKGMTSLRALRTPLLGKDADASQFLGYLFGGEQYADNGRMVPATLEYLEIGGGMRVLSDFALFECDGLLCVTLPESVRTVGRYAFYYCRELLAVNVSHLEEVAEHAFDSCTSLTRMDFGTALTSVGIGALEGCIGIRTLTLPFIGGTATENTYLGYLFGASVSDFAEGYYPPYLTRVTLLEGCTSIGDYAFYECDSLESVTVPEGVTAIGIRAFSACVRLASITLPNSLTTVGDNAFFGCLSMTNVEIEPQASRLSSMGVNAFYNCGMLKKILLPASLTALPASCFAGCVSLEEIDLGGVTQVGKNAFYKCTRLGRIQASAGTVFEDGNQAATRLLTEAEA